MLFWLLASYRLRANVLQFFSLDKDHVPCAARSILVPQYCLFAVHSGVQNLVKTALHQGCVMSKKLALLPLDSR